ncbi:MAG: head-tail connector protein [Candidatus Paceibacterota bacterium]|jgi:uncharacterized phiE125 gp8 family phage protein
MRFKLITAPIDWAVTLDEVKTHLRITGTDDDKYLQSLIYAAQQRVEEEYGLALTPATWEAYLDTFPKGEIEIYRYPIASITSVKYIDNNGATQTVSSGNYSTDITGQPARIIPDNSYDWPEVEEVANAVQIRFVTGWTTPEIIPADIKHALLLIIGDWYLNREDQNFNFTVFRRIVPSLLSKYLYR